MNRFAQAHRELTEWINAHPTEAQAIVQRGLSNAVRREISLDLIKASWTRMTFASDLSLSSIENLVADARGLGFLRGEVDLSRLILPPQ